MTVHHEQRSVIRIVRGQATSDGAGVRLTRVIGTQALSELDPFLLLDEFLSDDPDDYLAGFPDHPHRGFETVTYMLAGRIRHGDNQGNHGVLEAGDVQWMTAGRGIVHSEMPEQENGRMWGFQLWVNLPAADKMTAPRYQDLPARAIPTVRTASGSTVRVIAGEYDGARGPVSAVAAEPVYLDVAFAQDAAEVIRLPPAHNAFVYCYQGAVRVGAEDDDALLGEHQLGVLSHGPALQLRAAAADARMIVVAGRPFNEPVARYGPFVMNTREELMQAVEDLREGRF